MMSVVYIIVLMAAGIGACRFVCETTKPLAVVLYFCMMILADLTMLLSWNSASGGYGGVVRLAATLLFAVFLAVLSRRIRDMGGLVRFQIVMASLTLFFCIFAVLVWFGILPYMPGIFAPGALFFAAPLFGFTDGVHLGLPAVAVPVVWLAWSCVRMARLSRQTKQEGNKQEKDQTDHYFKKRCNKIKQTVS